MLEAYISLVRNGASVFKDLMPKHHITTFTYDIHDAVHGVPLLDLLIAVLQLAAVGYGLFGGFADFIRAWSKWRRVKKWIKGASHVEPRLSSLRELKEKIESRLNQEAREAAGSCMDSIMRMAVGACFFNFFRSTLNMTDLDTVVWTVCVMECLLAIYLYKALASMLRRRSHALKSLKVTPEDIKKPSNMSLDELVNYAENRLIFTWENQVEYHPTALAADMDHLGRAYAKLAYLSAALKKKDEDAIRDSHEVVHRIHKSARTTLSQVWLEVTTWSMDLVAFWATVVFPITYFYPEEHIYRTYISIYPGHELINWHGGFIGDLMWTMQPIVTLFSQVIKAYLEEKWIALPDLPPVGKGTYKKAAAAAPSKKKESPQKKKKAAAPSSPAKKVEKENKKPNRRASVAATTSAGNKTKESPKFSASLRKRRASSAAPATKTAAATSPRVTRSRATNK